MSTVPLIRTVICLSVSLSIACAASAQLMLREGDPVTATVQSSPANRQWIHVGDTVTVSVSNVVDYDQCPAGSLCPDAMYGVGMCHMDMGGLSVFMGSIEWSPSQEGVFVCENRVGSAVYWTANEPSDVSVTFTATLTDQSKPVNGYMTYPDDEVQLTTRGYKAFRVGCAHRSMTGTIPAQDSGVGGPLFIGFDGTWTLVTDPSQVDLAGRLIYADVTAADSAAQDGIKAWARDFDWDDGGNVTVGISVGAGLQINVATTFSWGGDDCVAEAAAGYAVASDRWTGDQKTLTLVSKNNNPDYAQITGLADINRTLAGIAGTDASVAYGLHMETRTYDPGEQGAGCSIWSDIGALMRVTNVRLGP